MFAALPDHSIFGISPAPERNAARLTDLSTGSVMELPAGGMSARMSRQSGSGKVQSPGQFSPQIDLPGIASNIAAVTSCLWDNLTSTLSVHSWSDFANLTCQFNGLGDSAKSMWDFGKEVTGCASGGVADCFFTASDVALFVANQSCRPDWVNSCVNPAPPQQGGGGAATPATILGITPFGTPVAGQQFRVQIQVTNLMPSGYSIVAVGPGCPTNTSCVVPSGVITVAGNLMNVPLTLAQGSFNIFVQQLGQLSNGWPLSVGTPSSGGGGGSGKSPNVAISFSPNSVSNSGGGTWSYSVTVSESGGVPVTLVGLNVGGGDYSSNISQWFGSNQLPANGRLSGSFTTTGSPGNLTWTFTGAGLSWSGSVSLLQ